jgi:hypothetical protein
MAGALPESVASAWRGRARAMVIGTIGIAVGFGAAFVVLRTGEVPARLHASIKAPLELTQPPARFAERLDVSVFQRGNIHTHSTKSDGDKPPEDVYAWYRDNGYAFVALTDHNERIDPAAYKHLERPGFVLVPGEEITMTVDGAPVHVNALCTTSTIGGGPHPSRASALAWAVGKVREQGGAAVVNHPNFEWALTEADLPLARGAQLLEIWSGHPYVNTDGDARRKSHEAMWDEALSAGEVLAGVAVDDTHFIAPDAPDPAARPGRGYVEVFAREPSEAAICDALRSGRLYSSSGASINRIVVDDNSISVWPSSASGAPEVAFIGAHGLLLASERPRQGQAAVYRLTGDERYVRARVTAPDGRKAWTQAYRVAR